MNASRGSIDPNDIYYIHASDSPGMMLVSKSFDGLGFGSWR